jgi:tetratricopeptide (TPR) repeat protein
MTVVHASRWLGAFVLAVGLGCQSEEAKLTEHLRRAEAYLEQEKASEAIIEYKNALRIAPNDAGAHYGLAKAYLAAREAGRAYWELQETVRLDPDNLEARLDYGQFLLIGRDEELNQAIVQADAALASDAHNARAHAIKARALERLKRHEEARAEYEAAVALQPESGEFLRLLAAFHVRRGDRPTAEPLFRRLTEVEPGFRSYAALGGFLSRDPERDREAEAAYRESLEQAEDDEKSLAYRLVAGFYFARERYPETETMLTQGIEATGNDLDVTYTLARFYHARGETEKADAMMEQAARAQPEDVRPYLTLSLYRGRNGDLDGALEAAEAALSVDPDDLQARLRKAELLIDMGYRQQSEQQLSGGRAIVDAVLAEEPDNPEGNFVKAKLDLADGRVDEVVAALRRTTSGRPDWARAHLLLGSALLIQGDRHEARSEVLRALELDAQLLEARRLLVRIHSNLGDHQLAAEEAGKLLRQAPEDVDARILLAQSLVRLGRAEQALQELGKLPAGQEGAQGHYARGRILMMRGEKEAARTELDLALQEQPGHPEILESLFQLDVGEEKLEESLERIRKAREADPQNARLGRLYGRALLVAGEPEQAETELRRALELDPNDLDSYQALASFLVGSGRLDESLSTYRKALETRPNSAELHLTVGSLYELSGATDQAIEHYEAAIRINPDLGVAKNNLAYLLAERGENLDRALDLAQEAKGLLPENPSAADTLGWVLFKKGITPAAINYLKEAEGGLPPWRNELGIIRHHLALAYVANQEPEKAREVLERALVDLEGARRAASQRGTAPPEPAWASDVRAMLEELRAGEGKPAAEG